MGNLYSRRGVLKAGIAGAAIVSAGSLLAACSSSGSDSESGGKPSRGGTLRIGVSGGGATDTLDPNALISLPDYLRASPLYSALVDRGPDFAPRFRLVESAEPNTDATEWVLRLRQGVEFHNGKAVTADDLLSSLRRIWNPKKPGLGASKLPVDVDGLKKLDNLSVRLRLARPVSVAPELLGSSLIYVVPEDFDPARPIGAGPFKFQSLKPGDRSVFVRHENYWDQVPYLDGVEIIDFKDSTALVNALQSDQIDAVADVTKADSRILEAAGMTTIVTPKRSFVPITMRADKPPFDDPRVREAFRLGVDRKGMITQAYSGAATIGNDLYAAYDPLYAADIPQRERDVERAKSLLVEAGQEGLTMEFVTGPGGVGWVEVAEVFCEQLKDIGVDLKLRTVDADTLFSKYYGVAPIGIDNWPNWSYLAISSEAVAPGAPYDTTGQGDKEYDAIYADVMKTLDEKKRAGLVHRLQAIQHERGGYIIPCHRDGLECVNPRVRGLKSNTQTTGPFNNMAFESVYLGD
ncbi:ABC transporter substrate-binding protein [Kribbella speibonae]|uniref:ABC transporter substrate-binding protein n=1 Tax=Kribbella speibonae TaxID=1572660 RepID=A0A4R0ITK8_9ACTN|nr:ABC transporter substrate-binding protein [Kribbella speibonae]TCC36457.1 ABC transporter substrate-binding protein [Kribbella speibonae]